MKDILIHFSKIIDYLEGVNKYNKLDIGLERMVKEQRENLDDLGLVLTEFEEYLIQIKSFEYIGSERTLNNLMKIHKYTTDLEWHISEINELNEMVIKSCSQHRE